MTHLRRWSWVAAVVAAVTMLLAVAAPAPAGVTTAPAAPDVSPVGPMRVLRLFDPPPQPWLAGHRGIDLRATVGGDVVSPADGVVTFAAVVVDRGVVSVRHHDGRLSSVEPVVAVVTPGQAVARGEVIGTVEARAHHCSVPCVHWGVRRDRTYLNPLDYLEGFGRVRLLPLREGYLRRRRPSS